MDDLQMLFTGFGVLMTIENLTAVLVGCVLGLIVGAMPGIGCTAGVSLLLPLTFKFNPTTAIALLAAVYYADMFGGSYSAILLNIPGDTPAIMTTLDGYPMSLKGRAGKALLTANLSSFFGGVIGMTILVFCAPMLAKFGLLFGPPEMTGLLLVAMTSISWLVGESPIKGLIATLIGIVIACIGSDVITGSPRYHFGNIYLMGGIPFVPLVIGLAGFSKVIALMSEKKTELVGKETLTLRNSLLSRDEIIRMLPPTIRSGFVGTLVGIMPGCGATAAAFVGYAMQKKMFKSREELGTGALEGVAAAEGANNAAAAGSFAPLLGLGIPGSGTSTVLLGGLMLWGLNPGPLLFTNNPEFAWGCIASLFYANIIALVVGLLSLPWLIKILSVPIKVLIPVITVVCVVGSYSTSRSMYGVVVMFAAGLIGYIFDKFKYPMSPLLLAVVLSPMLETHIRRAFLLSRGRLGIFFNSYISTIFMILFFIIVLAPLVRVVLRLVRGSSPQSSMEE